MNPLTIAPEILPVMIARLTPRQLELIKLIVQGYTNREVAEMLGIGRDAIQRHIHRMCVKTGLKNRVQLIVLYVVWEIKRAE